jgi:hypothetical protein
MARDIPDWFGCYATPAPSLSDVGRVRTPRGEQRALIANGLAVIKAAKKAGLPLKSAVVDGVEMEFGQPEAPKQTALTPLESWKEQRRARQA